MPKTFTVDMSKVSPKVRREIMREGWKAYWKGLGPRPVPVDHDRVKKVAKQIRNMEPKS